MARRRKRIDRDNPERWMVSYADFITLLFAFFVVMYAISSVNEGKYKVLSLSLNSVFGERADGVDAGSVRLSEQELYFKSIVDRRNARLAEKQRKQNESMALLFANLNATMTPFIQSGQMSISKSERGVVLDINANNLFKAGEAILQTEAEIILGQAANLLVSGTEPIEVEGHTDNIRLKRLSVRGVSSARE
jgi:chemotaxis protein MotB